MGRAGWFDEVMRFYDRFLLDSGKRVQAEGQDPKIAVQTNDGIWRRETSWPPADSSGYTTDLLPGSYMDDGTGLDHRTPTASGRSRRRWPTTSICRAPARSTVDVSVQRCRGPTSSSTSTTSTRTAPGR